MSLAHTQGITRFEYCRTQGWLARYYARGMVVQRLFSDSRYGYEEDRSRAAARAFLLSCATGIEPRPRFRHRQLRTAHTPSGRVGVCLVTKRERSGTRVRMWSVNYVAGGRRRTKTFRIHHYVSDGEAFLAAVAFRHTQELAMQHERRACLQRLWAQE